MANENLKKIIKESCFLALGYSNFEDHKAIELFDKLYNQACEEILSIGRWGVATNTIKLDNLSDRIDLKPLRILQCNKNSYVLVKDNDKYKLKKSFSKEFSSSDFPITLEVVYNIFDVEWVVTPPYLQEVLADKMSFKLCNALGFGNQEKALIYSKYESSLKEARYIDSCTYYNIFNELKVNNVV